MRNLSLENKKGVSEMVSYVMLIIIAVSLSILVFSYLKFYTPKDKLECPSDVSLTIQNYVCQAGTSTNKSNLTITLLNKGLFTVDAAYIRIGPENRRVKTLINDPNDYTLPLQTAYDNFYLFWLNESNSKIQGLPPGKSYERTYHPNITSAGSYGIEIEPAILGKGDLSLCPDATITQSIACS